MASTIHTAPDPEVPLPAGADPDNVDNWELDSGKTSRLVWSRPNPYAQNFKCDVRLVASQRPDGTIITGDPVEEPLVYVDGQDFSLSQARTLSLALAQAVALAQQWAVGQ